MINFYIRLVVWLAFLGLFYHGDNVFFFVLTLAVGAFYIFLWAPKADKEDAEMLARYQKLK